MNKMLILGSGMVAGALHAVALSQGISVKLLGHRELAVANRAAVLAAVQSYKPALIFHASALTRVNYCEEHPRSALRVNGEGTRNVCEAARLVQARLVYFSTDYVFDGTQHKPYLEDAQPNPLNAYGQSKLAGEQAVAAYPRGHIIRTSGVFGPRADLKPARNFFCAMAQLLLTGESPIPVVADQITAVTYAPHLAEMLFCLIPAGLPPVVHLTSHGCHSWAQWAGTAADALGVSRQRLTPVTAAEYGGSVQRPAYSVLGTGHSAAQKQITSHKALPAVRSYVCEVASRLNNNRII